MANEFVTRNGLISLDNSQITGSLNVTQGVTASLFGTSSWANNATTSSYLLQAVSASFASTASSADSFLIRQNATASNILVNNTLTAQTLVVQTVTSSIVYSSGSNIFGNQLTNVQQFTGSLRVTGSGNHFIMGDNVGINTLLPVYKLDVNGTGNFSNNLTVTGSLLSSGNTATANAVVLAASGGFVKSFAIVNNRNIGTGDTGSFNIWRCNVPCTASAVSVYFDTGTNVVVNASKNASNDLLAVNFTNSTADSWQSTTSLQNQNFNVNDTLQVNFVSFSGSPKEVTIQVNFTY